MVRKYICISKELVSEKREREICASEAFCCVCMCVCVCVCERERERVKEAIGVNGVDRAFTCLVYGSRCGLV